MATKIMLIRPNRQKVTFDAILSTEHTGTVTPTKHPVQYGASITDHAINEPDEVMLSIGVTDAAKGADSQRSVNVFALLRDIKQRRELVTLVTRLHTYTDMLITSLSAPDDYTTMNALKATIIFTQMTIATVSVVTVQQSVSSSKKTGTAASKASKKKSSKKKTKTTTNKTPTNKSDLKQIADKANIKLL